MTLLEPVSRAASGHRRDLFAEAREKYTIADIWHAFGYEGQPKSNCKSPFREDRSPSFSIFDDGRAWTDHATGEGGDVIEFVCGQRRERPIESTV